MVYVCDAVMGSGKTSATVAYVNSHPEDRFIYITPYLDEADRMLHSCNMIKFNQPSNKRSLYKSGRYSKLEDARDLIASGKNIASTHALFKTYDAEMLQMIRDKNYKLIIDENVEVTEMSDDTLDDINMLVKSGYLIEETSSDDDDVFTTYTISPDKEYNGGKFDLFFRMLKSKKLTKFTTSNGVTDVQYYWTLPPELINSFSDVFVLTYLFEDQGLSHMFKLYNIQYKNIGIIRNGKNYEFDFERSCNYVPDYVYNLKDMIDIVDDPKYNYIGDGLHDLSMNWFDRESGKDVEVLKKLIRQCYEYKWVDSSNRHVGSTKNTKRLWGTYSKAKNKLAGKGYKNNYLVFNSRATNLYREAEYLVYAVNLYSNVRDKKYYENMGIHIDDDRYALSTMIQWIWRSAIRDGKPVHLYIPSKRMRDILVRWIDSFSKGGERASEM